MELSAEQIQADVQSILDDLLIAKSLTEHDIFVIGTSTSEVIGERIGTSGSETVSEALFQAFITFRKKTNVHLAFQCCEHLNRALVVERETANMFQLEEVTVIPVKKAGGAMAAHAYSQLKEPVVVEFIKADAGIDIGDTLIGMHIKHVAVPVRSKIKQIGQAHVTLATTRPKLIGGQRAVYSQNESGLQPNC
ncbi:TIGR01440 family protein [Bacillus alkalicellulosilyticus]|uniref:TIGR01440 family protein n=1 Tax=Alkalihalobacterium alkalicellulosilyticum TaxID=1912214 RepID=UPI000998DCDE|nr:TIGR01440 family protein [Bacillus alkalicellulosilyticus]